MPPRHERHVPPLRRGLPSAALPAGSRGSARALPRVQRAVPGGARRGRARRRRPALGADGRARDGAPRAAPATPSGPHAIAREIIGELVARHGAELSDAVGRRELFSRHGADLMAAFDDYRRRAGEGAGSEPFRLELRERLGVDLFPRVERG